MVRCGDIAIIKRFCALIGVILDRMINGQDTILSVDIVFIRCGIIFFVRCFMHLDRMIFCPYDNKTIIKWFCALIGVILDRMINGQDTILSLQWRGNNFFPCNFLGIVSVRYGIKKHHHQLFFGFLWTGYYPVPTIRY